MTQNKDRHLLVAVSLFATTACATAAPVVRLSPRDPSAKWVQGRGVMVQENNGVRVALAYERNFERRIAFRMEVVNASGEPVHVDPRQAVCSYCQGVPTPENLNRTCPKRFRILDPESESLAAELGESRSKADGQNEVAVAAGLVFLGAFADAAASSKSRTFTSTATATMLVHDSHARNVEKQTHYANAVEFWQSAPLRRTTLDPGEATSGLLLVDSVPFVPLVFVSLQIGRTQFRFGFDQKTMTPYPEATAMPEDPARLHRRGP